VAVASAIVGVTVTLVVAFVTLAVYAVVAAAKAGAIAPAVLLNADRSAFVEAALVTVIV
jgi:hypothetical protein